MSTPQELTEAELVAIGKIVRAQEFLTTVTEQRRLALADRDAAIAELRILGWSMARVAEVTGLSPAMIGKIDRAQGLESTRRVERVGQHRSTNP